MSRPNKADDQERRRRIFPTDTEEVGGGYITIATETPAPFGSPKDDDDAGGTLGVAR